MSTSRTWAKRPSAQASRELLDRAGCAGNRDRGGAVDGADEELVFAAGNSVTSLIKRKRDGDHSPLSRRGLERAAAQSHDLRGVIEANRTGHMSGGDFTQAMADDDVGDDPPRLTECCERHLEGELKRLVDFGFSKARGLRARPELVDERPRHMAGKGSLALFDRVAKHGLCLEEVTPDTLPETPLA